MWLRKDLSGLSVTAAIQYLTPGAQALYGPAISSLQSQLPQIMASVASISLIEIGEESATYAITRIQRGAKTGSISLN